MGNLSRSLDRLLSHAQAGGRDKIDMQHYVHYKNEWTGASEPLKLRFSRPPLRVPDGLSPGQNVVRTRTKNVYTVLEKPSQRRSQFDASLGEISSSQPALVQRIAHNVVSGATGHAFSESSKQALRDAMDTTAMRALRRPASAPRPVIDGQQRAPSNHRRAPTKHRRHMMPPSRTAPHIWTTADASLSDEDLTIEQEALGRSVPHYGGVETLAGSVPPAEHDEATPLGIVWFTPCPVPCTSPSTDSKHPSWPSFTHARSRLLPARALEGAHDEAHASAQKQLGASGPPSPVESGDVCYPPPRHSGHSGISLSSKISPPRANAKLNLKPSQKLDLTRVANGAKWTGIIRTKDEEDLHRHKQLRDGTRRRIEEWRRMQRQLGAMRMHDQEDRWRHHGSKGALQPVQRVATGMDHRSALRLGIVPVGTQIVVNHLAIVATPKTMGSSRAS